MLIGYMRISTADQSLDLQRDALRAAGCTEIFEDTASGGRKDRVGLANALAKCQAGDVLVVWKLDRLGRSLGHLIEVVTGLEGRQIGFRSLTEAIDTTTAAGRLIFNIFGALAEFERALIRERTNAGLAAARARGRVGGRKPKMSRAQIERVKKLLTDPDLSMSDICEKIGVKRNTVYKTFARLNSPIDRSEIMR